MSTLTLKQDRKQARIKKQENERRELLQRAFKSVNMEFSSDSNKRLAVLTCPPKTDPT